MFERFTKSARAAVVVAQEEARELRSDRIDVEHILLGVVYEADAGLGELLDEAGITVDAVRRQLIQGRRGEALGDEDAAALKSIGIDLDAVRESLGASFGDDALERAMPARERGRWRGGHIPFSRDAKKTIELALREALRRKDDHVGAEHILLGVLRAPNDATRRVVEMHIPASELHSRVEALLGRAA